MTQTINLEDWKFREGGDPRLLQRLSYVDL